MSSTVIAALVGVGGSVIVSVVAFVTTWAITSRTLSADRDRRILDKEIATYELVLSELMRFQTARMDGQYSRGRPGTDYLAEYFALRNSDNWIRATGLLLAYAPQPIHDALDECLVCYVNAAGFFNELDALKRPEAPEDATSRQRRLKKVTELFGKLMNVVSDSDERDQILANEIRSQLGKPPVRPPLPSKPKLMRADEVTQRVGANW